MDQLPVDNLTRKSDPGFLITLSLMVALLTVVIVWVGIQQSNIESTPAGKGAGPAQNQVIDASTPEIMPPTPPAITAKNKALSTRPATKSGR